MREQREEKRDLAKFLDRVKIQENNQPKALETTRKGGTAKKSLRPLYLCVLRV